MRSSSEADVYLVPEDTSDNPKLKQHKKQRISESQKSDVSPSRVISTAKESPEVRKSEAEVLNSVTLRKYKCTPVEVLQQKRNLKEIHLKRTHVSCFSSM